MCVSIYCLMKVIIPAQPHAVQDNDTGNDSDNILV